MFKKTLNFGEEAEEDLFFLLFLSSFKRRLHTRHLPRAEKNREREREKKRRDGKSDALPKGVAKSEKIVVPFFFVSRTMRAAGSLRRATTTTLAFCNNALKRRSLMMVSWDHHHHHRLKHRDDVASFGTTDTNAFLTNVARFVSMTDARSDASLPSSSVGNAEKARRRRRIFSAAKDALFGGGETKSTRSPSSLENAIDEDEATSKRNQRRFSSRKIVRNVTPSQLFAIVADVNKYHEFLPFCRRSRVTNRIDKDRFEAELEIGFKVFNEKYTSKVTLDAPRKVVAEDKSHEEDGGGTLFEKMRTVWRFRELEEEEEDVDSDSGKENDDASLKENKPVVSTVVDFEIAFKVKSSTHAAALSVFFEDVANTQIQAFEKRCRSLMALPSNSSSSSSSRNSDSDSDSDSGSDSDSKH